DSGRSALGDCGDRLLARRVDEAGNTEEDEAGLYIAEGQCSMIAGWLEGEAEHALPVGRGLDDAVVPVSRIQWLVAPFGGLPVAHRQQLFRGTFDKDDMAVLVWGAMKRGHEPVLRLEGYRVDPSPDHSLRAGVQCGFHGQGHQRPLHGVAFGMPMAFLINENSIVAQQRATDQLPGYGRRYLVPYLVDHKTACRLVACALDHDFAACGDDAAHRHLVAGQRAGLVRTDDGGRAQCLDGRKPPDDRVARSHAL